MKTVRIAYKKENNKWIVAYTDNDETSVLRSLAADVVAKKINKCQYIKFIKRVQKYSHVEITVMFDNGVKSVYFLPALYF